MIHEIVNSITMEVIASFGSEADTLAYLAMIETMPPTHFARTKVIDESE